MYATCQSIQSFHNNIDNFKIIMTVPYSVHVLNDKYYTPVLEVPNSLFMDDANSLQ